MIGSAGWFHLAYFGLVIPVAAVRGRKKLLGTADQPAPLPNRVRHFQRTAATLVMFAFLSLVTGWRERIPLFPAQVPPAGAIAAGVLLYAAAIALMRPLWRRSVQSEKRLLHLFMPSNAEERFWWIAVAVLAGVGEEITWRGVQTTILQGLTASLWIAATVCALSFAFGHYVQGWKSMAIIFAMALGFQALVWMAGSLYVAMAVHVAYDITAGITYGRLGKELGYSLQSPGG